MFTKKTALEERETLIANGTDSFTSRVTNTDILLSLEKFAYIEGH